jgi:glycerate-2-kinase
MSRATLLGLDVSDALARNDSFPCLEKMGDLLVTGLSGTNVMDIYLAACTKDE